MICTKCNNEIPDGAKFCPSCGASAAAAPAPVSEKKFYCEKCGLELMKGAKFCSVCGGTGVAREEASPIAASVSEAAAAVNLNKPSQSDSLVSAMNSASTPTPAPEAASAPASYGVPTPSNSVPMPTGSVPMPSNGASSGFSSGVSGTAPSYVASVSADSQAPVMPLPNMSGAAAVPAKKGKTGKVILLSVLGVLLLAIAAAAVMFFTNRAAFLSTFMGKAKYATMVEGMSIKTATEKLDIPAIANGVKSASGTYQALSSASGGSISVFDLYGMSNNGGSAKLAPMMYGTMDNIDPKFNAGFDVKAFSEQYAELLQSVYGANTVNETLSVKLELSDSVKSMLASEVGSLNTVNEILDYVNNTTLSASLSAKDDKAALTVGTQGKLTVDVKVQTDGQNVYFMFPFASSKAIMLTVPAAQSGVKTEIKTLDLDEKELERLITECVEIYLDYYKEASIEMEDGSIKAAGVEVEGKLITAEFKGKKLTKLFTDIAKHIVSDDYLMGEIAEYANSCGADTTKQELIDEAVEAVEDIMEADDDDKLVIETVIDRNGNVLGKTVKAMEAKDVLMKLSYAEADNHLGFEAEYPDEDVTVKITVDKNDDQSGSCKLKISDGDEEMSFTLTYSDVKKAEFCGKETCTGKFTLSMDLPESFSDQLGKEAFAAVNGASLSFSLNVNSANSAEAAIGLDVPKYGSIEIKETVTVTDDDSALNTPSNVIDATNYTINGEYDGAVATELEQYYNDIVAALKKTLPEEAAGMLESASGPIYPGSSLNNDIDYLLDDISSDMHDIEKALNGEYTCSMSDSELEQLMLEYIALHNEVTAKGYRMTKDEFEEFEDRYYDLWADLPYFNKSGSGSGSNYPISTGNERIDGLTNEITNVFMDGYMIEYLINLGSVSLTTEKAQTMYDEAKKALEDIESYAMSIDVDDISQLTDAQLTKLESLVSEAKKKVDAFKTEFNLSGYEDMFNQQ